MLLSSHRHVKDDHVKDDHVKDDHVKDDRVKDDRGNPGRACTIADGPFCQRSTILTSDTVMAIC